MESLLRESMDGAQIPRGRELTPAGATPATRPPLIAVVGLGAVGLPTALALRDAGHGVLGLDLSEHRLDQVRRGRCGLAPADHRRLLVALDRPQFELTSEESRLSEVDAVVICVPTPAGADRATDLTALRRACGAACRHARRGQTIVLTAAAYVGATRDLLIEPLTEAGFDVGGDICVAVSPDSVPRLLGADDKICADKAHALVDAIADPVIVVASPEAAERQTGAAIRAGR